MSSSGAEKPAGGASAELSDSQAEKSHFAPAIDPKSSKDPKTTNNASDDLIDTATTTTSIAVTTAEPAPAAAAAAPASSPDVKAWKDIWCELKGLGWTCKRGTGLMTDYYYIKTGCTVKGGELNEDYFVRQEDVRHYYDTAWSLVPIIQTEYPPCDWANSPFDGCLRAHRFDRTWPCDERGCTTLVHQQCQVAFEYQFLDDNNFDYNVNTVCRKHSVCYQQYMESEVAATASSKPAPVRKVSRLLPVATAAAVAAPAPAPEEEEATVSKPAAEEEKEATTSSSKPAAINASSSSSSSKAAASTAPVVVDEPTYGVGKRGTCDYKLPHSDMCPNNKMELVYCGYRQGNAQCQHSVHHACQCLWEQNNGFEQSIPLRCSIHHPREKYTPVQYSPVPSSPMDALPAPLPNVPALSSLDDIPALPSFDDMTPPMSLQELEEIGIDNAAWDDLNEHGDVDDDSDEEGNESLLHSSAVHVKTYLSTGETVGEDEDEIDEDGVLSAEPLSWRDTCLSIQGAPLGWNPPIIPDKWTSYTENDKKYDAPCEEDIDNPGDWSLFAFRPQYTGKDKKSTVKAKLSTTKDKKTPTYINHFSPAGAIVLPADKNSGKRIIGDWELHYNGWHGDKFSKSTYVRGDAVKDNLKPTSRAGSLDVDVFIRHGFNASRVANDPLMFLQMIFPIALPKDSAETGDHRMPFFSMMTWFTHIYAAEKGIGMGFGHKWVLPDVAEMVRWASIPIRHGSLDGKPGSLSARWKKSDPRYDELIANAMSYTRFLELKRYMKLNNNSSEAKRGTKDYNPCAKYDNIFKVLTHNVNYCCKSADLDPAMDESTWGFGGYMGEAGWRLMNKPFPKGTNNMFICISLYRIQLNAMSLIIQEVKQPCCTVLIGAILTLTYTVIS
jgi:hypothetical protein